MSFAITSGEMKGFVYCFKTNLLKYDSFQEANFQRLEFEERLFYNNALRELNKQTVEGTLPSYIYCESTEDQEQSNAGFEKAQALFTKTFGSDSPSPETIKKSRAR